ncbi:DeoR/GlpR family DNA-binding transcription regulator [Schaalia naturae]|uniref:DeoR/GlpR family DNA-binding transcription regulator n=1 Tax=Schaalia naturae TaxID=635203 RepID=A0ABW2SMY5_9ACTO
MTADTRTASVERRRSRIVERVRTYGAVTISELALDLGVSDMTIRRDADALAHTGEVVRLHGALRGPDSAISSTFEYTQRTTRSAEQKARIGAAAARDIDPHDTLVIDAGTTALQVAVSLPESFVGTIITHSIPVIGFAEQRPLVKAIVLGGEVYRPSRALVGSAGTTEAAGLRAATFFLGAAAVDARGVYASVDVERGLKEALMDISDRVVLVVDSSKLAASAPVRLCGWDRIDVIVTDDDPGAELLETLHRNAVECLIAAPQP